MSWYSLHEARVGPCHDMRLSASIHAALLQVYSAQEWNSHLPRTVEAFFVMKMGGYVPNRHATMQVHQAFLERFHLTEHDVPMLAFDPHNWEEPFSSDLPASLATIANERWNPSAHVIG